MEVFQRLLELVAQADPCKKLFTMLCLNGVTCKTQGEPQLARLFFIYEFNFRNTDTRVYYLDMKPVLTAIALFILLLILNAYFSK